MQNEARNIAQYRPASWRVPPLIFSWQFFLPDVTKNWTCMHNILCQRIVHGSLEIKLLLFAWQKKLDSPGQGCPQYGLRSLQEQWCVVCCCVSFEDIFRVVRKVDWITPISSRCFKYTTCLIIQVKCSITSILYTESVNWPAVTF